ncbi:MAG: hypothetical protein RL885_31125 [Planctomycetota bacterium]
MRLASRWIEAGLVGLSSALLVTSVLVAPALAARSKGLVVVVWSPWMIGSLALAAIVLFSVRRRTEPRSRRAPIDRFIQVVAYLILLAVIGLSIAPMLESRK